VAPTPSESVAAVCNPLQGLGYRPCSWRAELLLPRETVCMRDIDRVGLLTLDRGRASIPR
jgi:hypothetical protein